MAETDTLRAEAKERKMVAGPAGLARPTDWAPPSFWELHGGISRRALLLLLLFII